jgi:hypothetical protein
VDEIKLLSFDLGIVYENLGGDIKTAKVNSLVNLALFVISFCNSLHDALSLDRFFPLMISRITASAVYIAGGQQVHRPMAA